MNITLSDAITLRDEIDNNLIVLADSPSPSALIRLSPVAEVLMREAVKDCDRRRANHDD